MPESGYLILGITPKVIATTHGVNRIPAMTATGSSFLACMQNLRPELGVRQWCARRPQETGLTDVEKAGRVMDQLQELYSHNTQEEMQIYLKVVFAFTVCSLLFSLVGLSPDKS